MGSFEEKLTAILRAAFPAPDLIRTVANAWGDEDPALLVFVVSDKFRGVDDLERQEIAWLPLKEGLTIDECLRISLLITSTSAEEELIAMTSSR